jgi:hypothetical protein
MRNALLPAAALLVALIVPARASAWSLAAHNAEAITATAGAILGACEQAGRPALAPTGARSREK